MSDRYPDVAAGCDICWTGSFKEVLWKEFKHPNPEPDEMRNYHLGYLCFSNTDTYLLKNFDGENTQIYVYDIEKQKHHQRKRVWAHLVKLLYITLFNERAMGYSSNLQNAQERRFCCKLIQPTLEQGYEFATPLI